MGVRVGIVGVSGYGGSELLRLSVGHPAFEVVYASGESTAGQRLSRQFPALSGHPTGDLVIQPFVPMRFRAWTSSSPRCPPESRASRSRVCRAR